MNKLLGAGLALGMALLGGCALVPGQRMDTAALNSGQGDVGSRIRLVPITPKLIAMDQAEPEQATVPAALLDYRPDVYRIGPGDVLLITVWEHPELTAPSGSQQQTEANGRLVRPDGTLFYPYVGNIQVAGLSLDQLREKIATQLADYIQQPQVDVNVIGFNSQRIWLNGAFVDTGTQAMTVTPLTLGQALGKGQINTTQADLSDLSLVRDGVRYHLDLDAMQRGQQTPSDIYLKDGDHLFLAYNDRKQIYLMGEVSKPQAITFKTSDVSLTQALGQVGGLNQEFSKGKAAYVVRGVADLERTPATVYQLDLRSPSAYVLGDAFKLRAGDLVFVGAADVTRWNRFISQLLPFSSLIGTSAIAKSSFGL